MSRARSRSLWRRSRVAAIGLGLTLSLAGCKRQPIDEPEPPAEIYLDPSTTPPDADAGDHVDRDRDPPQDPPAQTGGDPGTADETDDPPDDTPDFKATLEAIPGEAPDDGRDGLAEAGTCEGGARAAGEHWKVKCNTCTCQPSGEVTCTLMACFGDEP